MYTRPCADRDLGRCIRVVPRMRSEERDGLYVRWEFVAINQGETYGDEYPLGE
jgi:hypothetical protein